ncbi:MAG: DUF2235 domain-containing protein [Pseudonocardiaceae bacterium]
MRHLIVCCDGTWNTPQQGSVTNVARLHDALAETAEDGVEQVPYYLPGVGTVGGLLNGLLGGAFGVGLAGKVTDAYHWLTTTYRSGDRIALFGFSRGAYTVRSLAGMIATCGLLDTDGLDDKGIHRRIDHVYRNRYRPGHDADPGWRDGLAFRYDPDDAEGIPVHFIGVWETVGSLGIPDNLGWLNLLDSPRRYTFHDVTLNPRIRHARHAVAMDERGGPFSPTLWSEPAPGQDVKQVWFPGSHLDVGGGNRERGLSDRALQWMIDEAGAAAGLAFDKAAVGQIRPNPLDVLHDDFRSVIGSLATLLDPFLEPRPRAVPLADPHAPPNPSLDSSVYRRQHGTQVTDEPYRPTRVLAEGESATVSVFAREPWNETGLYLDAGDYTFAAEGEWMDLWIPSGPAGTTGLRRLHPVEAGRLVGTLIGQGEKLFRRVTGNKVASFPLSRREESMPWMSLVGVVANDAEAVNAALKTHERIDVGTGAKHSVTKGGYLYAFANDAWGFYGNNRGSVRLTVTRTA